MKSSALEKTGSVAVPTDALGAGQPKAQSTKPQNPKTPFQYKYKIKRMLDNFIFSEEKSYFKDCLDESSHSVFGDHDQDFL